MVIKCRQLFVLLNVWFALFVTTQFANAQVMCTPDDITDQYWDQLQALEAQENKWLDEHAANMDKTKQAALAAKRQVPRQKLYRKMIALDKAARAASKQGDDDLACDKSLVLDGVIMQLVELMEFQLKTPAEQKLVTTE